MKTITTTCDICKKETDSFSTVSINNTACYQPTVIFATTYSKEWDICESCLHRLSGKKKEDNRVKVTLDSVMQELIKEAVEETLNQIDA